MIPAPLKSVLLRVYRAGVLVVIAWLIHEQHAWFAAQRDGTLSPAKVRDFFPTAASLGPRDPQSGVQRVLDGQGNTLGLVTASAPLSDNIIGYSGPTNTLIALDTRGKVLGLRVLHCDDTPEHLAKVLRNRRFFDGFKGIQMGGTAAPPKIDAVTGATLTSSAIAQGVLARLGRPGPSMRFPNPITLDEVRALKPEAASLRALPDKSEMFQVFDKKGTVIARATRTAPQSDSVIGYKGPSDSIVLMNGDGTRVEAFRLRKSFDTQDYVAYVTGDDYFTHLFDGMPVAKLAGLDFNQAKIEGVSGATETSWAVAEGLKRRAQSLTVSQRETGMREILSSVTLKDWGLAAVVLLSVVMTFTPWRGNRWARWTHQALLMGYAGWYSGSMLSQALIFGWAEHSVPWRTAPVLVLLGALAVALPLLTRRQFYCHHYCPHGALQQWLAHRLKWQLHVPRRVGVCLEKIPIALLLAILVLTMMGVNANLNALEPFDAWLIRVAGWSTIGIAAVGLLASLFVPMAYCRYGCPTGALLKFVRYAGHADGFGAKDLTALGMAVLAMGMRWFLSRGA